MQENVCLCLGVTLNPAEPSAQASLTFLNRGSPLSFNPQQSPLESPTHLPSVSSPSATFPTAASFF